MLTRAIKRLSPWAPPSWLIWPAVVFAAGIALGYIARGGLIGWLQAPLRSTLLYTNVPDADGFALQASLVTGLLCVVPVLAYNLVQRIRPLSRRQAAVLVVASSGLVVAGVLSAYYLPLPASLQFLRGIHVQQSHPLIAADSYIGFVMNYLAVFALAFQLPLLALQLNQFPPADLQKWRPWVIIGAFAAALILPVAPDPVSQFLLALPVAVFCELSFWLVVLIHARSHSRERVAAPPAPRAPTPQRLPMAIAVPHRPRAARTVSMEPVRSKGPAVIDMRPKQ